MKRGYVRFLQDTFDSWGVDRIVHIGDLVDWNSISYHEKHPSNSNASLEHKKALKQVQSLHKAFPSVDWLIGNHDALTYRQAKTAGIPDIVMKPYADQWEVDWVVHDRKEQEEMRFRIDGVIYRHGDGGKGGRNAAIKNAQANCRSVVQGHHHSNAGVEYYANQEFRMFGLDVGCGIDMKLLPFEYARRFPRKPVLGCGIVVNGKSAYFEPWLLGSR